MIRAIFGIGIIFWVVMLSIRIIGGQGNAGWMDESGTILGVKYCICFCFCMCQKCHVVESVEWC